LLDTLFNADNGGSTFLRNISILLPDYTAIHPRNTHRLPWLSVVTPGGTLQQAMAISFQIIHDYFIIQRRITRASEQELLDKPIPNKTHRLCKHP
jgi:hypothetical protein